MTFKVVLWLNAYIYIYICIYIKILFSKEAMNFFFQHKHIFTEP
jgi:hypothetical protein